MNIVGVISEKSAERMRAHYTARINAALNMQEALKFYECLERFEEYRHELLHSGKAKASARS